MPQTRGIRRPGKVGMQPSPVLHSRDRAESRMGRSAPARVLLVSLVMTASACGVDDRTLLTSGALGSSGGAPADGAGGRFGVPSNSDAGSNEQPLPVCVYLGDAVAAGCETIVRNPGFTSNIASWSAEPVGISEGWLDADASDNHHSGSLVVLNLNYKTDESAKDGINGGAARQCVSVTAGTTYDLAADVFVPMGQGAGFEGSYTGVATLSVFYYTDAACEGRTLSNYTSMPVMQTDTWVHVTGSTTAPKESQSMVVRLATLKPFRQVQFEAHFDNVFVREHPPQ